MDSEENLKVVGNVNAISSTFKWEIDHFSRCRNVDILESPKFMTNSTGSDIQWHLRMYPKKDIEDIVDHYTLVLYANTTIKAVANLKLLNANGQTIKSETLGEFEFGNVGLIFLKLISRNFIKNRINGTLNDKMTIVCKITYNLNEIRYNKETSHKVKEEKDDLLFRLEVIDKYESLFNDKQFSDVSLISADGIAVNAHKCILVKTSSMFADMFNVEIKGKQQNTVTIADVKHDVLVEMIRFIYTRKINNIDALACQLAEAADKYALKELKNPCEKAIIKNLSLNNVILCLELADRLSMDNLKEKAIEFIVDNARDITDKPEFDLMPRDILRKIFHRFAENNQS